MELDGGDEDFAAEEHEGCDDEELSVGKNFHFDGGHARNGGSGDGGEEDVEVIWGGGGSCFGELQSFEAKERDCYEMGEVRPEGVGGQKRQSERRRRSEKMKTEALHFGFLLRR